MTLSYELEQNLANNLFNEDNLVWCPEITGDYKPSFENHSFYSKFLEVTLPYNGECFIPVMGFKSLITIIQNWFDTVDPTTSMRVVYPLYAMAKDYKKTTDSIIRTINKCPSSLRLVNIVTSKGLDYYGGNGVILDSHWNPFLLCGFIGEIDRLNRMVNIQHPVCYVAPEVFSGKDILSRAIVKKIIPSLPTMNINVPRCIRNSSYVMYNPLQFRGVPVTIQKLSTFFTHPCSPLSYDRMDEELWETLDRNINDIL